MYVRAHPSLRLQSQLRSACNIFFQCNGNSYASQSFKDTSTVMKRQNQQQYSHAAKQLCAMNTTKQHSVVLTAWKDSRSAYLPVYTDSRMHYI